MMERVVDCGLRGSAFGISVEESGRYARLMVSRIEGIPGYTATSETFPDFEMHDDDCERLWDRATEAIKGRLLAQEALNPRPHEIKWRGYMGNNCL